MMSIRIFKNIVCSLLVLSSLYGCGSLETTRHANLEVQHYSGRVICMHRSGGTLSEYAYFELHTCDGRPLILFNSKRRSLGFHEFTNKNVMVQGTPITGYIGWKRIPAQGIMVSRITLYD